MVQFTPNYSIPYPELSDPPDGATETENLAISVDTAIDSVADTVVANATHATLLATLLGSGAARYDTRPTAITALTSITYVAVVETTGGLHCGFSFVAPPSGIVRIAWGANARSDLDNITLFIGTAVRQGATVGSGTVQSATADGDTCQTDVVGNNGAVDRVRYVTGLTPGTTYNVQVEWRIQTTGHTGNCAQPWIDLTPQLA